MKSGEHARNGAIKRRNTGNELQAVNIKPKGKQAQALHCQPLPHTGSFERIVGAQFGHQYADDVDEKSKVHLQQGMLCQAFHSITA